MRTNDKRLMILLRSLGYELEDVEVENGIMYYTFEGDEIEEVVHEYIMGKKIDVEVHEYERATQEFQNNLHRLVG